MNIRITICAIILCCAAACSGNASSESATVFYPDSSATDQAAALVANNTPRKAAQDLVNWLADAPSSDRQFGHQLAREVFRLYTISTDTTAMPEFSEALEAAKDSLDVERQVKVFVAVSKPSTLGRMLRNDPQGEKLAALVTAQYESDSLALAQFNKAYHAE